ncbi:transcription antiterminator [Erysipelothrix rhusiopathiae]|nr:transcription antiterminator [Erysipelothrix rhusiopathiae]MDE8055264.1 transcription antiterminator [Erysipelothrix rhusiopathiae]MDE8092126.1 transcription antiterminator [Erysipelothrix rhusiopathiae]MDE8098125.1 transcription antiterminator [Erysipelothrix rhusiopathiae]MDE8103373.1 transcription antiterminator [Erysipelothrix rhusiopathiae]
MMHQRRKQLLNILCDQNNYISSNQLARQLNVSNKTVRNDLDLVEHFLAQYNVTLERKTGYGILLNCSEKQRYQLKILLESYNQDPDLTPKIRQDAIALTLLTETDYTMDALSDLFYISKSSVYSDIKAIEKLFLFYNITLHRYEDKTFYLTGKERSLRNAIFDLLAKERTLHLLFKIIKKEKGACGGDLLHPGFDMTDDEIADLIEQLPDFSVMFDSINNYAHFIIRILVTMSRQNFDPTVEISETFKLALQKKPYLDIARQIIALLEKIQKRKYHEHECFYLQVYLLAYLNTKEDNDYQVEQFVDKLIVTWTELLPHAFVADGQLIQNLLNHLKPTAIRLAHDIIIQNPLLPDIEKQYQNTFRIVKESIALINNPFWNQLEENEMGFLALHLASAIERFKKPLKTILICTIAPSGGQLLKYRLEHSIPEIVIDKIIPYNEFKDADYDADLLIINSQLNKEKQYKTPMLSITALPSKDDLDFLRNEILDYYNKKNDPENIT